MNLPESGNAAKVYGKCDAKGCGSPATVNSRFGARFCRGHAYLAEREKAKA